MPSTQHISLQPTPSWQLPSTPICTISTQASTQHTPHADTDHTPPQQTPSDLPSSTYTLPPASPSSTTTQTPSPHLPSPHFSSISMPEQPVANPHDDSPVHSEPVTTSLSSLPASTHNLHPMQTRAKSGIFKPKTIFNLNTVALSADPTCFSEANKHLPWRQAMAEEFNALISNNTWELVPFDNTKNVVGSKWIYKTKYNSDGSIERHKARLVGQGFSQQAGVDFSETFSPVIKPTTVRVVLSLAISFGWVIRQLDVKNAFLHGHLTEEVYMRQPRGFTHPLFPNHLCRLRKALYGLKQAPRAWFHRFSSFLLSHSFTCSKSDNSLFIYRQNNYVIYLLLYVDDIIITGNSSSLVSSLIHLVAQHFAMKDLGDLHYFLGVQAKRSDKGLFLSQHKYVCDLLSRFHLHTVKPVRTPLATRTSLSLSH
ncbi:unnamed protein product [Cuscuta epithymum]|uniref:Reverse transcriptase Ty1/copia-type domain-containing protein n=1 Tax=Cuscuta epithymum TaxID=186058 RepID=A0AAV0CPN9_9ASTE|nr:unnamed protein product [Cuscuta epithymum]